MKTAQAVAILLVLCASAELASAQGAPSPQSLTLTEYVRRVLAANPDLKAAQATLEIANAQIKIAKVFPDPEISVGVSQYDVTRRGNPTILATQLSLPIELGGKRRARIAVAQAGLAAATHDYSDAVRSLRALAADTFIDALHARLVVARKQSALGHLQRLVDVNQRRLAAGDIAEVELAQSRVEMQQFRADVLDAQGEQRAAEAAMAALLGDQAAPPVEAAGGLQTPPPTPDQPALLAGIEQRSDVRASALRLEGAQRQVDLERAKHVVDVTVGAGWLHSFSTGGDSGIPAAEMVTASLSVPIPLSHVYHGEIEAAESAQRQAQNQLLAVRVRARAELHEALARFDAAAGRASVYDQGTLRDANAVLDKTLYSYQRGEASLVEVLIAERTASEIQLAYLDALADRAHALVAVGQAAGLGEPLLAL